MRTRLGILLVTLLLAAPPQARAADALLISGGYVMTMEPATGDLARADILVRDGRIVAVGHDLDAAGAQRIDVKGQIVLPGFVDTHSHLWSTSMRGRFRNTVDSQYFPVNEALAGSMRPADIEIAILVGALELLQSGITTTAEYFDNVQGPAHAQAALRALDTAGIRARLYYGGPDKSTRHPIDLADLQRLAETPRHAAPDARVTLGLAWRLPRDREDAGNWAMRQHEYHTARHLGLPIQVHASVEPGPILDALQAGGYLASGVEVVHATDATPAQLAAIDAAGASLSLTPVSEHRVGYGLTRLSHFARVRRQGLGIDGNALSGSGDMYANLRLAALTESGGAGDEIAVSPRALLELATRRGAEALGMGGMTGRIAPGLRADLQIISLEALNLAAAPQDDPAALIVYSARPENVSTVIVDGIVRKRDGKLVGVDVNALLERFRASAIALQAPDSDATAGDGER
jgi:5-methylthioadenosine/S-adenosylhomocysteine deaminase